MKNSFLFDNLIISFTKFNWFTNCEQIKENEKRAC